MNSSPIFQIFLSSFCLKISSKSQNKTEKKVLFDLKNAQSILNEIKKVEFNLISFFLKFNHNSLIIQNQLWNRFVFSFFIISLILKTQNFPFLLISADFFLIINWQRNSLFNKINYYPFPIYFIFLSSRNFFHCKVSLFSLQNLPFHFQYINSTMVI